LLEQRKTAKINFYTSTLILANIHYLLAKEFNKHIAKELLKELLKEIEMLPFEPETIKLSLASEHVDFEDTIQFYIAKQHACEVIISRNVKHYKKFDLPVLTAEEFLAIHYNAK
jgi:predicted nucleic acid-binding protein